nr:hypothetical protein [Rhodoplanes sp.]
MHRSRFVETIWWYDKKSAFPTVVIAGLDPAIHHPANKAFLRKSMDARVEPAHDALMHGKRCVHPVARWRGRARGEARPVVEAPPAHAVIETLRCSLEPENIDEASVSNIDLRLLASSAWLTEPSLSLSSEDTTESA